MTVVSDAGPLMALAKIGGLDLLFHLSPQVLTPPAVYDELVTAGLRLGAPDAELLEARYQAKELVVVTPAGDPLPLPALLGPGEEQSIRLAIEIQADWLLVDDFEARRAALANLHAAGAATQVKGALGALLAAWEAGHLSKEDAVALVESIRQRPDIWISSALCDRVLKLLEGGREEALL